MPRTRDPSRDAGPPTSKTAPIVVLAILSRHYREALALALQSPDLIVREIGDCCVEGLLDQLLRLRPRIALVDLPSTEATVLIREARRAIPGICVIALNQIGDERAAVSLFEMGVAGYLDQSASVEDVRIAIRGALVGELHCPPRIAAALARRLTEVGDRRGSGASRTNVSPKEAQVLPLLEQGLTNKEIAQHLGVEESTVKNHVHNILRKFGVHQRGEAVQRYRSEDPRLRLVGRDAEVPEQSNRV